MSAPLRILLVDDDAVDRKTVRRALRAASVEAEFTEAGDVAAAREALAAGSFDCVFLDYQLPGGDGLRVLREARRAGVTTPIVMLTGQRDDVVAVELMKAGASDYLVKDDLDAERLARALQGALRIHAAEEQTRRAVEQREAALSARSRFYAAMSHELRTPINAIIGYTDLLLVGAYGTLSEKQTEGVTRAQRAGQHLLELVNDVLDISKLEAGKLEIAAEPTRLPELIEDLFSTVRPLAEERGCELRMFARECGEPVLTDPRRVRQILMNLLSNAIKFGRSAPVEVHCRADADHEIVVLEVVDHGIGIPAEDIPRVFEEFVQLASDERRGTGLGLSISQRFAELLGGRLEAESQVGEGSTFRLVLPRQPSRDASDATAAPQGTAAA